MTKCPLSGKQGYVEEEDMELNETTKKILYERLNAALQGKTITLEELKRRCKQ